MTETVYLSLGSNLGDREWNLGEATRRLSEFGEVTAQSALYETEPVDVLNQQPWYLNCAVALQTDLAPARLLEGALEIEKSMGRRRAEPKEPRTIDIDIVLFAERVIRGPGLTIPHPAMHQRRFVLEPLAEIAPEALHPLLAKTVAQLRQALPAGGGAVRRLGRRASGEVR